MELCITQSDIKPSYKYVKIQGGVNTSIYHIPHKVNDLVLRSRGKLGNIYNLVNLYYKKNSL